MQIGKLGLYFALCCAAGLIIGRGLTWWMLDGKGPWYFLVGFLLYIASYLWMKRFTRQSPSTSVSISFSIPTTTKPNCPDGVREDPKVYPICLQLCKDVICKKNPGYKGLTKRPNETEEEYRERHT